MLIKWIYPESEEILGIRRNKGDVFEIGESIAKQLESQRKGQIQSKKQGSSEIIDEKDNKSKGKVK